MRIGGFSKTTLLDYPEHVAATVFTQGCNFRCPFCHNAGLLTGKCAEEELYTEEEIFAFLQKRKGILQGVCITGGEPTLQPDLPDFIRKIKQLGYLVKLDTNGYQPEVVRALLADNLLDYVAMDIKNSPKKYAATIGTTQINLEAINDSIILLKQSEIPYEYRTTIVQGLHTREDLLAIGEWLQGGRAYYLQSYKDSDTVLCTGYQAYPGDTIKEWAQMLQGRLSTVAVRGIE